MKTIEKINRKTNSENYSEAGILGEIEEWVHQLLGSKLKGNLSFHNIDHTLSVVEGATEIMNHLTLTDQEKEIVLIACWFHDTGFTVRYQGHEEVSAKIAQSFLKTKGYPAKKIQQVLGCIHATRLPQNPQNELEQIICDADLYHLSRPDYIPIKNRLRQEWGNCFAKQFSDADWHQENISFLETHSYFTHYGKEVLGLKKAENLRKVKQLLAGCLK